MMDPQLDPLQESFVKQWATSDEEKEKSKIYKNNIDKFNPRDLTEEDFFTAGRIWMLCRENKLDDMKCGIGSPINPDWGIDSLYGLWFVRGNLLRDFAAFNKVETAPYLVRISRGLDWKSWRLVGASDNELTDEDWKLLDRIAELTSRGLGVHHVCQKGLAKIEPVRFRTVAKTSAASALAAPM